MDLAMRRKSAVHEDLGQSGQVKWSVSSAMSSHREARSTCTSKEREFSLSRTRAQLRRATQKLRRTMMTSTDWPPPGIIFNSKLTKTIDDDSIPSSGWSFPCCFQRGRSRSPEIEDYKSTNLSQMLMGTYANGDKIKKKKLELRTGADGSLICADHVDVNMLIEGFREFERRFQYGTLMPFANVLPPVNLLQSSVNKLKMPEIKEEEEEEVKGGEFQKSGNMDVAFQKNQNNFVIVEGICEN